MKPRRPSILPTSSPEQFKKISLVFRFPLRCTGDEGAILLKMLFITNNDSSITALHNNEFFLERSFIKVFHFLLLH